MSFDFDMHRIGRTIAQLRREHNMTQMQLADEMNVSFQAVSNWERGQSMPDISKLPELAELFGVTIDHLLGRSSLLVEKAVQDKLEELPSLTVDEVAGTAPLLPPRQIDTLTDRLMAQEQRPDMTALLPFLPTEKVDELLRQQANQEGGLTRYAPFCQRRCDRRDRPEPQQGRQEFYGACALHERGCHQQACPGAGSPGRKHRSAGTLHG